MTTKRFSLLLALVIALTTLLSACSQLAGGPNVDWQIEISGAVDNPTTISYRDLAGAKQIKLQDVIMRKSRGEDEKTNWEGAAVKEVLAKAKPKASATGITAFAEDGYAIQIPMADLEKSVIALKQGDKVINDDGKGAVRLVVPDKPANFWILGLKKIKVEDSEIKAPTPKPTEVATPTK